MWRRYQNSFCNIRSERTQSYICYLKPNKKWHKFGRNRFTWIFKWLFEELIHLKISCRHILPIEIALKENLLYTNKNHSKQVRAYMRKALKSLSESLFYLAKAFLRAKMQDLDSFNKLCPWYLSSAEVFLASLVLKECLIDWITIIYTSHYSGSKLFLYMDILPFSILWLIFHYILFYFVFH